MDYKTKFVQDLCSINTDVYEEVILFAVHRGQFIKNVENLRKPSLQALVHLLLMQQRGTLARCGINDLRLLSVQNMIGHLYKSEYALLPDDERFGWYLRALALLVLCGEDTETIQKELKRFVETFESCLSEKPLYYDVLKMFLILGVEVPELASIFHHLSGNEMLRKLTSESNVIRMKALACLQTMMKFIPTLYDEWMSLLLDSKLLIENKMFILYHLMETLLRQSDMNDKIMLSLQCDQVWAIVIQSLTSKDAVGRKEALATVQYAISYAKQSNNDLNGQYFSWCCERAQSDKFTNAWQSFVTIADALNESQTHLILPALELMASVNPLHVAWKNVLLRLILQHENGRVVSYGLQCFLNERLFDPTEPDLEQLFLETFNRMSLFENVPQLITSLCNYYNASEAVSFLLDTVPEISWNSIPYYCIAHVIHNHVLDSEGHHVPMKSLTSCVKTCHEIKNVALRYISIVLLLKTIGRVANRVSTNETSKLLLAIMDDIENLSTVFTIPIVQLKEETGSTFCDGINEKSLLMHLPEVNITDSFFIQEFMVSRIEKLDLTGQERLLTALIRTNLPVCLNILEKLPRPQPEVLATVREATFAAISNIMQNLERKQPVGSKSLSFLQEMCHFVRADKGNGDLNKWNVFLEDLNRHVTLRLDCFDYEQTAAAETIQLAHILVMHTNNTEIASKFFQSVSLNELKDTFRRHQISTPPSIDELYAMVSGIYLRYCQSNQPGASFTSEEECSRLVSLLDVGNIDVLILILEILYTDMPEVENCYDTRRLTVVDRCYKEVLNYRKSDHFMKLIKKFIEMLLQPYVQLSENSDPDSVEIHPRVTEYVSMFLEQASTIYGLANIVFETIFKLPVAIILNWGSFGKLLLEGMIFGVVQKRDQKLENEVTEQCGMNISFKQHPRYLAKADARVRVLCVLFLYRIVKTNHPDAVLFLLKLERMLYERFVQITKAKERYYADSITHRLKLRIVQALCVVVKLTGNKPYSLLEVMLYETNQPNINYLLELIVADSSIDTLTIANSLANERVKVSGIQSVFVILWLRCCQTNSLDEQYIYLLLPWTMAQNFSTRLYAQITIKKLIARFSPQPIDSGPFREIFAAVNSYLRQGNVERNIEKCMKDFRFNSVFDYGNLLTIENVFHNIPKVSAAPTEDYVGTIILKECFQSLRLDESNLGQALEFDQLLQSEKRDNLFLAQSIGGADFVQRKIVPLKNLEPSRDMLQDLPERLCVKKMDCSEGLIVVASLVNRAPNLGGLARTSEIFAVEQFVINSLQDLTNKEFQALSMTAEKWLNVGELKTHKIVEYLEEMKGKGYAVVGAEQTTGSKPIVKLQFPKKCILVLGHEKNGLPAEIIRHLDLIGEIPQYGVVRSLNVHVTGAIFMWEYAKQHLVR